MPFPGVPFVPFQLAIGSEHVNLDLNVAARFALACINIAIADDRDSLAKGKEHWSGPKKTAK